uniref:RAB3GAP2_C domain-containing protein n=1 Tax=Macrostomum lignano TaxID=282301 RepID=A0A1I8I897_9PLAT
GGSALDRLSQAEPGLLISVIQSGLTAQSRTLNFRTKCAPSVRMRACALHCNQILAARLLAFVCHSAEARARLVSEGHLRKLVDTLDPNYDPHLLCLLLQAVGCLTLDPSTHEDLLDLLITDSLLQLLLPSDEWYYTNHTTRYAPFVKFLATRILVHLGQFRCLAGRFDLFGNQDAGAESLLLEERCLADALVVALPCLAHPQILTWARTSPSDLLLAKDDVKELLGLLATLGDSERVWCQGVWSFIKSCEQQCKSKNPEGKEKGETVNIEYKKFKQMVTSGDLPCTKDEAATLAAMQLHLDDAWPEEGGGGGGGGSGAFSFAGAFSGFGGAWHRGDVASRRKEFLR